MRRFGAASTGAAVGRHLSDDEEPFRGDVLGIEAEQDRSGATITLVGEFDMTGSERFWAFVRSAWDST